MVMPLRETLRQMPRAFPEPAWTTRRTCLAQRNSHSQSSKPILNPKMTIQKLYTANSGALLRNESLAMLA